MTARGEPARHGSATMVLVGLAIAVTYFAAAKLGLSLAFTTRQVSAVWPPSGIAFVAYSRFGFRAWPAVFLGAFIANATHDEHVLTALGISVGNTVAGVVGVYLAKRAAGFGRSVERVKDVVALVVFGAAAGSLVSATCGVFNLALAGAVAWPSFVSVWWVWWVGDSLGVVVIAPLLLTWTSGQRFDWHGRRLVELGVLALALVAACFVVFVVAVGPSGFAAPRAYVAFPFLIWSGLRFGTRETSTTAVIVSILAVFGAAHGRGPFVASTLDTSLIQVDAFVAVIGATALLVGATTSERRRAYEALVLRVSDRTADRFQFAIEAAATGMIIVDATGDIILVNAQVEKLFGYPRGELVGRSVEVLVPERTRAAHRELRAGFFSAPRARSMGAGSDLAGRHKDGSEVPIEVGLSPFQTPEGSFVLASIVDIAERKRSERDREELLGQLRTLNAELEERVAARTAQLSATLDEREVLLKEVHHRVKNNLQVISSLINMQLRKLSDPIARSALEEYQTRVQAIALIHEKLYQSRDYAHVRFSDYARSLAQSVFHATGRSTDDVTLELSFEEVAIAVDKAIPCGLILNELITNALKHAFPEGRRGTIWVELREREGRGLCLSVSDDGVGIPPGFDPRTSASLGHKLLTILTEQLDGTLVVRSGPRTTFEVCFRAE